MAFEFKLPDVGEGLHEAELLKWLVQEGAVVREDQPLLEVQTDKAAVEITSPVSGTVARLLGQPGDILRVHSPVVIFAEGGAGTGLTVPPGGRALAAPATRKMARELGVEISQVPGSGPAGRVTPDDLQRFTSARSGGAAVLAAGPDPAAVPVLADAAHAAAPADERLPLKGIRKVIADRMVKSQHTAPHVTTVDEVDMTDLTAFRSAAKELAARKGIKLSFLPFFFKALAVALGEFPHFNAQIDDQHQEIVLRRQYHLGFALDTEAGLMVPVVRDVDRKSVFQIAAEIQDLTLRGRAGKLQPDELKGSTFTVSNQGSIGGLFFTPVINHPEVAILGIGQTQDRPVVRDGQVVVRQMAYLALSFDHRLIDGAPATRFLSRVMELIQNPTLLMMEAL